MQIIAIYCEYLQWAMLDHLAVASEQTAAPSAHRTLLLCAAIGSVDGSAAHSAEAVRFRIKALIDDESPAKILSDDRIVEILNGEGIDIARRTVAKYRESMKIPSSVQRRRQKNLKI